MTRHPGFIAGVIVSLHLALCGSIAIAAADMPAIGSAPPDELGKNVDREPVLLSDSSGKVRVITFWADWCGPCLKEIPILNTIQQRAGSERLQVITVNLEQKKRVINAIRKQLDDSDVEWIQDTRGRTAKRFGVRGIPHLLIIDVDNTIVHRHIGYSESALPKIVDELNALLIKQMNQVDPTTLP